MVAVRAVRWGDCWRTAPRSFWAIAVVTVGLFGCIDGLWPAADDALVSAKADELALAERVTPAGERFTFALPARPVPLRAGLGPVARGEQITVRVEALPSRVARVIVALFDGQANLVDRRRLAEGDSLNVVMPYAAAELQLALQNSTTRAGDVDVVVTRQPAEPLPPRAQLVWLNFAGADGVSVHGRPPISFGPFDAAQVDAAYAGMTPVVVAAIKSAVRAQYAEFNVEITSSDEGPPPAEAHSVVYFGGHHPTLLGLGDQVDRFNRDPSDAALVYIESFGVFADLGLDAKQMGQTIGHVASHELAHLLGLFHTHDANHLMDHERDAWAVVAWTELYRAPLADSVFAYGYEDAQRVLELTIGRRTKPAEGATAGASPSDSEFE